MLVTSQMLRDLGATNVIAFNEPALIINGGVTAATQLTYESLDEIKFTTWFQTSELLVISELWQDDSDKYVVWLFNFNHWQHSWNEDKFSA